MPDAGAEVDDPETALGWSLALPLTIAGAVQFTGLFLLRNFMEPHNWLLFLAVTTAATLPVGLLLWFGVFRRRNPHGWWKIPLILWPAGFLALFTGVAVVQQPGFDSPAEFNRLVTVPEPMPAGNVYWAAGESIAQESRTVAERAHAAPAQPLDGSSELREIERIRLDFARQMAADGREFEAALEAAGYRTLLSARYVRGPGDLAGARRKLETAVARIRAFRARYEERVRDVEQRLIAAPIGDEAREALVGGFRARRAAMRSPANQVWQLEHDAASAFGGMIDLLAEARWRREGERFVFDDRADQRRFDARRADVDGVREEEESLREQLGARTADDNPD
jgi:hypothetical protein